MPKTKLKKIKAGKIKRHKFRKQLGPKKGFGRPWSATAVTFRVEFSWVDENENESNEQVHWVECRKFQGEEYQSLKAHYTQSEEQWSEKETIESKFVCVYVARFLVEQIKALGKALEALGVQSKNPTNYLSDIKRQLPLVPSAYDLEPMMLNQAFIFPTTVKGNKTIRMPIYQIKWTENLALNCGYEENIDMVLKNSIWHQY